MHPDQGKQPDRDEWTSRLIDYHETLAAEPRSSFSGAAPSSADSEMPQDAQSWLNIFERVRRSQTPHREDEARAADDSSQETSTPEGTATLGRFKILRVLGRGGCGIVFLAVDPRLDRQVALKVPRPESLVNPELRRRFLREGEAAAGLKHAHIVPIYEAGEIGPVCYLAQEYCEGGTLAEWLSNLRKPIEPRMAANLVAQLATAVHFAHNRGILHRDLKPGNILLEPKTPDSGTSEKNNDQLGFTAKVADFGLAKLMDSASDATTQGMVVGTPAYMAPEQAQGRQDDVGTHTDVYALGVILFELLTGRPPITGKSDMDTIIRITSEEPAFPGEWKRQLPRDLRAVCLKCLEKKPELRYESAGALAEDLRRFVTGQPTAAHPLGHLGRMVKWCKRRPSLAALMLVSILATIGLLSGGWWHATRLGIALQVAEQQRTKAETLRVSAQQSERRTLQEMYATHIGVAQDAVSRGDLSWALELLSRYKPRDEGTDLREFTWHYLWKKCHGYRSLLQDHEGAVYHTAFSPDGSHVATAGKDGTAKVWDMATGELLMTLVGHAGEVNVVEFSPDGVLIATASDDKSIKLWDAATGSQRATLAGHTGMIVCLAFSPDGKTLVSGGEGGVVRRWDVETSQQQTALAENLDWVEAISFSPDGQTLAISSHGEGVQLWDFTTGQLQRTLIDQKRKVVCQAFSHDGEMLATGNLTSDVKLWDVATGHEMRTCLGHFNGIHSVTFSPDDRVLVSGSTDSSVRFWDTETGNLMSVLPAHTDRVWSVALAPDGRTLATASRDGTAKLWDTPGVYRTDDVVENPRDLSETMLTTSSGRDLIFSGSEAAIVEIWSLMDKQLRFNRPYVHDSHVFALSPDGETTVHGRLTGEVSFRRCDSGELIGLVAEHPVRVRYVTYSPDGQHLASVSQDGTVKLWNATTQQVRRTLSGTRSTIQSLSFSSDGSTLASSSAEPFVRFWDVDSGEMLGTTESRGRSILSAIFSPRDFLLATADSTGEVSLWKFNRPTSRLLWHGHSGGIQAMAFSPDGTTIAGGNHDGKVQFWDVRTGHELLTIDTELGSVFCIAFAQDGKTLAAIGNGRDNGKAAIRLWNVAVRNMSESGGLSHSIR